MRARSLWKTNGLYRGIRLQLDEKRKGPLSGVPRSPEGPVGNISLCVRNGL